MNPTDEQQAVMTCTAPVIACNATAGSGKTATAVERVKSTGARTVFLAFNREAAGELGARLQGIGDARTLHSASYMCAMADDGIVRVGGRDGLTEQKAFDDVLFAACRQTIPPAAPELSKREWRELRDLIKGLAQATVACDFDSTDTFAERVGTDATDDQIAAAQKLIDHMYGGRRSGFYSVDLTFRYACEALDAGILPSRFQGVEEVIVDEAQDLSPIQWHFIDSLVSLLGANLVIIGDDDQCIYRWRHASLETFLNRCRSAELLPLGINFRCPADVVEAAARCIALNEDRIDKDIRPNREDRCSPQVRVFGNAISEGDAIADAIVARNRDEGVHFRHFAVVSRTHSSRVEIERALLERRVPFQILGSNAWARKEIDRIMDFLKAAEGHREWLDCVGRVASELPGIGTRTIKIALGGNPQDLKAAIHELQTRARGARGRNSVSALSRALEEAAVLLSRDSGAQRVSDAAALATNLMFPADSAADEDSGGADSSRSVCDAFMALAKHVRDMREVVDYINQLRYPDAGGREGCVTLSTVHRMKGLQFDHVFVAQTCEGTFPHARAIQSGGIEDERRLWYVGITRTLQSLTISFSETNTFGRETGPSQFIIESGFQIPLGPEEMDGGEDAGLEEILDDSDVSV